MADRVVVMRAGVVEQMGAPLDLYDRPCNRFVAGFIGSPAMNFVEGIIREDGVSVRLDLPGEAVLRFAGARPAGETVTVGFRPEHLSVTMAATGGNILSLPVGFVERTGSTSYVLSSTTPEILLSVPERFPKEQGSVNAQIAPELVHLFSKEDGTALL